TLRVHAATTGHRDEQVRLRHGNAHGARDGQLKEKDAKVSLESHLSIVLLGFKERRHEIPSDAWHGADRGCSLSQPAQPEGRRAGTAAKESASSRQKRGKN